MGLEILVDDVKKGQTAEEAEPSDLNELELDRDNTSVENVTDDHKDSKTEEDEDILLPERFRGKTRADIAKSYSELEKVLGRQSTELGDLRKVAEKYVKDNIGESDDGQSRIEYEDLLEDPNSAIDKRVSTKVKSFEEKLSQLEQNTVRREIKRLHSDVDSIIPDPQFQQWVLSDPVRVEQFRQANEGFDVESADTILTQWKTHSATLKATQDADKAKRDKALKDAASESSSTGQSSKRIYRRADLIKLRVQDPDRFEALQPEIIKAYSEGRVR